jgi:hypothetical protein
VVSNEQRNWNKNLNEIPNVQSEICYGFEEARNKILSLENINT